MPHLFSIDTFHLLLSTLLLLIGVVHLYYPKLILRINDYMRERVFRDAPVLLHSRRIGTAFVFLAFILMFLVLLDQSK